MAITAAYLACLVQRTATASYIGCDGAVGVCCPRKSCRLVRALIKYILLRLLQHQFAVEMSTLQKCLELSREQRHGTQRYLIYSYRSKQTRSLEEQPQKLLGTGRSVPIHDIIPGAELSPAAALPAVAIA